MSGCPNGCPCDDYICPTTTPSTSTTTTTASANTDVLILNTYNMNNVPVVTNAAGLDDRNICFEFGDDTEVLYSCGLTFRNNYFVFGGGSFETQISQIIDCQLKRIGQLSFDHNEGGCANVDNNYIYLCFNDASSDSKKCRMANSPTDKFEQISDSIYDHKRIQIGASNSKFYKTSHNIN